MNSLEALITDTSKDIVYTNLSEVDLDEKGKPVRSWMKDWSLNQRIDKFFEFCRAYDEREDSMLKANYQQLSHRLHWHECPFVEEISRVKDPERVMASCLLFSFTNEHWQTFLSWYNGGIDLMSKRFESDRHSRSDLFQIYYPKDTKVTQWLATVPEQAAKPLSKLLGALDRPYTMMEFTKKLNDYFVINHGFKNAMYPSKNASRHVAMTHPEWVDPNSFLHGGTGFFDGLQQIFDGPNLMGKCKYDIDDNGNYVPKNDACKKLVEMMNHLANYPSNPIHTHVYLNLEDKLCMHFKYMAMRFGNKKQTKQIPYNWVYPDNWSLKTGKYDRKQYVA